MIAVQIRGGCVEIVEKRRPRRRPGYSLIRLLCAGICNTDIELRRGYYGFQGIPGHEFVGEVVESDDGRLVDRRVVGEINLPCRNCSWCLRGMERHCPRRTVLGIVKHPGAFAEYLVLPDENLHIIPAGLAIESATFTEPVAAACEITDQVDVPRDRPVAVLGDGKLGLLVAQVLGSHGADVRLFGKHKDKVAVAESLGIRASLVSGVPPRPKFDLVVEATGRPEGLIHAISMTRPRGTVVLKSTIQGRVSIDTAPVIVNEITMVGSRCGRFEPALRLLGSGRVRVEPLISARLPLAAACRGFELAERRGTLKVLLTA